MPIGLPALKSAETAAAVGQERGRGGAARLGVAQSAEQYRNVTIHESARARVRADGGGAAAARSLGDGAALLELLAAAARARVVRLRLGLLLLGQGACLGLLRSPAAHRVDAFPLDVLWRAVGAAVAAIELGQRGDVKELLGKRLQLPLPSAGKKRGGVRAREGRNTTACGGSLEVERLELTAATRDLADVREVDVRQVELFKVRVAAPDCTD